MSLCPFYGMRIAAGEFNKGETENQCALKSFPAFAPPTPCHMEMNGSRAEWEECFYRTNPQLQEIVRLCIHKAKAPVPH